MKSFSDFLETGQVTRLSIIHLPTYIQTRTRVDQEALRRISVVEVCFSNPSEAGLLNTLHEAAVADLRSATSASGHEVRWGVLAFDAAGKERFAVFIDTTGKFVQVGNDRLLVGGRMLAWIRSSMNRLLK